MLKSALNYLSSGSTRSGEHADNDFVGQTVELGQYKLFVRKVIAEGGFAFVFIAEDSKGKRFLSAFCKK